jgi:hypothetical protein
VVIDEAPDVCWAAAPIQSADLGGVGLRDAVRGLVARPDGRLGTGADGDRPPGVHPYVAAASFGALALALGTRRWWAAGVAAFAVVALGFCVLPRIVADADAARPATPGPA